MGLPEFGREFDSAAPPHDSTAQTRASNDVIYSRWQQVCLIEETVEHVLKKCKAYNKERRILKEELQAVGCQEFTITSILNDGPNSGKQIKAVIRFIKNSGLYNRI